MDIHRYFKNCSKCGQHKSLDEFNPDKFGKEGIRAQCKVCQYKVSSKRYYREHYKPQAKEKARQAYNNGIIQKPLYCENCQENKPLDKHHPNYNRPLEVVWLCRKCHRLAG